MRTVVVLLGCVVALAGCVGAPSPSPSVSLGLGGSASPVVSPSVLPSVSPSPSVSPTPTPTSFPSYPADLPTQDPETAAIIHGWQEYFRVYEKFAADPFGFTDFTEINYVTTGEASRRTMDRLDVLRKERIRSEGGLVFRDVEVSIDANDRAKATITYCVDVSHLRVFYVDSGDVWPRSGTILETSEMTMRNDGLWKVAAFHNEVVPC